jgi:CheY-like chemotaxis protein
MTDAPAILVVDDDADIRCNVKDILDDLGYRADTAHDGPSALHMVKNHSYDVALLDFKMPGMDGATLYAEMKKLRPEIVAIMVTAYAGSDGVSKAKAAGTWKVLRKPVDFAALLPLLEQAASEPVVLLVDDDTEFCENLWQLLRDQNFRVRIAQSESDGIAQAQDCQYDVAVVDLGLGAEGDGRNVIRKIRSVNPNTKIILATGSNDQLDSVGADLVLQKPIDVKRMLDELGADCGRDPSSN